MTRLTRYIESRGFWFFVGALCLLLLLRHVYVRVEKKQARPENVTPMRVAS